MLRLKIPSMRACVQQMGFFALEASVTSIPVHIYHALIVARLQKKIAISTFFHCECQVFSKIQMMERHDVLAFAAALDMETNKHFKKEEEDIISPALFLILIGWWERGDIDELGAVPKDELFLTESALSAAGQKLYT